MTSTYITTTIPYVNARPHLRHALELVQGDVLARHRPRRAVPQALRGPVLRRLRTVLRRRGAGRRALPRPRHAARAGVGRELVLPPVPLRRPAARPHRRRRDPRRAGRAP